MDNASKSRWIESALRRHESHLIRYAAWILGDIERARDVVQETFLRLCKEIPERIDDHLPQWLFTVCRNLAYDVRKKENRMTPLHDIDAAESPLNTSALLERKETMRDLVRIVETLPKNQREVIYLKFQSDLSYKEISEITSLSVSNVGFLIHSAIKSIRARVLPAPETLRRIP